MAGINTGLRIDSGEIDPEFTKLKEVAPEDYYVLMCKRRSFVHHSIAHDCRCLLQFVEDAPQMFGPLGFADADDFIARGLELDPEQVRWALDGLHRLRPHEACSFEKAIKLGKHGGDRSIRHTYNQGANSTLKRGSTSVAYIKARLERDGYLDLLAEVEFKSMSARQAAIQVGYIKGKTVLQQLCAWWKKASPEERQTFLNQITP